MDKSQTADTKTSDWRIRMDKSKTFANSHITGPQIRAARSYFDMTRADLQNESGVSAETIKNIEHGGHARTKTIEDLVLVFRNKGLEFSEGGVRLKSKCCVCGNTINEKPVDNVMTQD